jgi:hypothetical protein
MKKLSILFAVVAFMMSATTQAQMTKKPMDTRSKSKAENVVKEDAKVYGTITVFMQNRKENVKFDFSEMIQRISPDKALSKSILDIAGYRFSSLGEALNVISSHGWTVDLAWTTETRGGTSQHFLISNMVGKLSPAMPWKDKSGKDSGSKDAKSGSKSK